LPDELAETSTSKTPGARSKIEKPARSGLTQPHLFCNVRQAAFSFPVYDGLAFDGPLPSKPASLPDALSRIWHSTAIADGGLVRATASRDGLRDHLHDKVATQP